VDIARPRRWKVTSSVGFRSHGYLLLLPSFVPLPELPESPVPALLASLVAGGVSFLVAGGVSFFASSLTFPPPQPATAKPQAATASGSAIRRKQAVLAVFVSVT